MCELFVLCGYIISGWLCFVVFAVCVGWFLTFQKKPPSSRDVHLWPSSVRKDSFDELRTTYIKDGKKLEDYVVVKPALQKGGVYHCG